jgi:arylsulfatase A-like enzyme
MVTSKGQNTVSAGETGAIQVWPMSVPRELYHTDWVAERTLSWLSQLDDEEPWFCWMSFPDPHHPWDVPDSELHRVNWRDVPLPALYREDPDELRAWLSEKPRHWQGYFDGSLWTNLESPREFVPSALTADQIREINAMTHIENELIDEACGRVLDYVRERTWLDTTDIFFTTDHGELQGDFGLLFKGPYHIDALMRLPFIWQPAACASVPAAEVTRPVGHLDLARTFCHVAGIEPPEYCEGQILPVDDAQARAQDRDTVLTQWDSEHGPVDMHLKSIYHHEGWLLTSYGPGHLYDGSEGELYNMDEDPQQIHNLWDDPKCQGQKTRLLEMLNASLPEPLEPRLPRLAPV